MKKSFKLLLSILAVLTIALSACGKKEVKPALINEKTDKCSECNMAVMNNQFATEIILENGKVYTFDDIGCLFNWESENKNKKIEASFVRDYDTKNWINLEKAHYVYAKDVKTPMSYNVVSFKNDTDAEKFAKDHNGEKLSYSDLKSHEWKMNKEMMHMDMNKDMNKDKDMNMGMKKDSKGSHHH